MAAENRAAAVGGARKGGVGTTDQPIEDRVLSTPGFTAAANAAVPTLLQEFYARIAPRILLPSTARLMLKAFGNVDVKAEKVGVVLRDNPYYEFLFMKQVEALSKRENLSNAEAAIVLLGMQKTRDLIVSLQLTRLVGGAHPEWDPSGKLKVAPDQVLKYAMATEEAMLAHKRDFSDVGYAAGVAYDLLALLFEDVVADPAARKKVQPFVDETYRTAQKAAKIAVELARGIPDFTAKRYLIPLCILSALGRAIAAMLDPGYVELAESAGKAALPRAILRYAEEKRFGVGVSTLGVAALQCLRLFKPIERAALFVDQPYFLKARDRNLYQLSSLVLLSANIAAQFQMPKGTDDPIIAQWRGPELRDFKVDARMLVDALPRIKF